MFKILNIYNMANFRKKKLDYKNKYFIFTQVVI